MARLPLAWRVILLVALIEAAVLGLSAAAMLQNARRAIAIEVRASQGLARGYVIAAVGSLVRDNDPATVMQFLPGQLFQPRHVRILVVDGQTSVTHRPVAPNAARAEHAPEWFHRLLAPPPTEIRLPVRLGTSVYGEIVIVTDPGDEIDEVWEDFRALFAIGGVAYVATLGLLGVVVTRALRPLTRMSDACARMESGDYATRIGVASTPELSALASRIDSLAATLERTMAEKDALNRRLQIAQDDERKAIALELHDEYGPCLFGLGVEARAVLQSADTRHDEALAEHARTLLEIVEQMQGNNRRLLERLRPMELGQLPLSQVLDGLIARFAEIGGDVDWRVRIDADLGPHDESSALAIYRITQEALTNCLRHAAARLIDVRIALETSGTPGVRITVRDDGGGFATGGAPGLGLRGMKTRAESLGGRFAVGRNEGGGAVIEAWVPAPDHESLREAS